LLLLVVSHLKIVEEMLKLAPGARHQIRMKLVSSALSEGSAADVAGRSLLSETYKVTDGDSLSRAILRSLLSPWTDEQLVGLRHCFCKGIRCWYVLGMLYVFMGHA